MSASVQTHFIDVTKIIEPIVDRNLQSDFVEVMVEQAKALSPYLTGHNRRSISFLKGQKGRQVTFAVGTMSGYGGYLEFGTKRRPATPYFLPAAEIAKAKIKAVEKGRWER